MIKGILFNKNVQHVIAFVLVFVLIQLPKIYQLGSEPFFDKKIKIGVNDVDGGKSNEGNFGEGDRCSSKIIKLEDEFMKGNLSRFILQGDQDNRERMVLDLNCTLESIGNVSNTTIIFKNYSLANTAWYYDYARIFRKFIDDVLFTDYDVDRILWVLYDFDGNSSSEDIRSICQNDRNGNDVIVVIPKYTLRWEDNISIDSWMGWDIINYQQIQLNGKKQKDNKDLKNGGNFEVQVKGKEQLNPVKSQQIQTATQTITTQTGIKETSGINKEIVNQKDKIETEIDIEESGTQGKLIIDNQNKTQNILKRRKDSQTNQNGQSTVKSTKINQDGHNTANLPTNNQNGQSTVKSTKINQDGHNTANLPTNNQNGQSTVKSTKINQDGHNTANLPTNNQNGQSTVKSTKINQDGHNTANLPTNNQNRQSKSQTSTKQNQDGHNTVNPPTDNQNRQSKYKGFQKDKQNKGYRNNH